MVVCKEEEMPESMQPVLDELKLLRCAFVSEMHDLGKIIVDVLHSDFCNCTTEHKNVAEMQDATNDFANQPVVNIATNLAVAQTNDSAYVTATEDRCGASASMNSSRPIYACDVTNKPVIYNTKNTNPLSVIYSADLPNLLKHIGVVVKQENVFGSLPSNHTESHKILNQSKIPAACPYQSIDKQAKLSGNLTEKNNELGGLSSDKLICEIITDDRTFSVKKNRNLMM